MPLSALTWDCVGVLLSWLSVEDMKNMRIVSKKWHTLISQE